MIFRRGMVALVYLSQLLLVTIAVAAPKKADSPVTVIFNEFCATHADMPACEPNEPLTDGRRWLVLEVHCSNPPTKDHPACEACADFSAFKKRLEASRLILDYHHRREEWLEDFPKERIERDVNDTPQIQLRPKETFLIQVTHTNALLYAAEPGKIEEASIEALADMQAAAAAGTGGLSLLTKGGGTSAHSLILGTEPKGREPDPQAKLKTLLTKMNRDQDLLDNCRRDAIISIQRAEFGENAVYDRKQCATVTPINWLKNLAALEELVRSMVPEGGWRRPEDDKDDPISLARKILAGSAETFAEVAKLQLFHRRFVEVADVNNKVHDRLYVFQEPYSGAWHYVQKRSVEIGVNSPYSDQITSIRKKEIAAEYRTANVRGSAFGAGPGLAFIKKSDDGFATKLGLMVNYRFLEPRWAETRLWRLRPGIEAGAAPDSDEPAFFVGLSFEFLKYVRLGLGYSRWSAKDGETLVWTNSPYIAVNVSFGALRLFAKD